MPPRGALDAPPPGRLVDGQGGRMVLRDRSGEDVGPTEAFRVRRIAGRGDKSGKPFVGDRIRVNGERADPDAAGGILTVTGQDSLVGAHVESGAVQTHET